jgi:hypothetical protein
MMEALRFYETSALTIATLRNIPEEDILPIKARLHGKREGKITR